MFAKFINVKYSNLYGSLFVTIIFSPSLIDINTNLTSHNITINRTPIHRKKCNILNYYLIGSISSLLLFLQMLKPSNAKIRAIPHNTPEQTHSRRRSELWTMTRPYLKSENLLYVYCSNNMRIAFNYKVPFCLQAESRNSWKFVNFLATDFVEEEGQLRKWILLNWRFPENLCA